MKRFLWLLPLALFFGACNSNLQICANQVPCRSSHKRLQYRISKHTLNKKTIDSLYFAGKTISFSRSKPCEGPLLILSDQKSKSMELIMSKKDKYLYTFELAANVADFFQSSLQPLQPVGYQLPLTVTLECNHSVEVKKDIILEFVHGTK